MERNYILAAVLSLIVLGGYFWYSSKFYPPPDYTVAEAEYSEEAPQESRVGPEGSLSSVDITPVGESPKREEAIVVETDLLSVKLTNVGGDLSSFQLKEHQKEGIWVEMVDTRESGLDSLSITPGESSNQPIDALFFVERQGDNRVEFYREFQVALPDGELLPPFMLRKIYTFIEGEYLFELNVVLENSVNDYIPLNDSGIAYTLSSGAQIGPEFEELGKNSRSADYREFYYYSGNKRELVKFRKNQTFASLDSTLNWTGIAGKYFTYIIIPDSGNFKAEWDIAAVEGHEYPSTVNLSRKAIKSGKNEDTYRIYIGPRLERNLQIYNNADENSLQLSKQELDEIVVKTRFIGWLETALAVMLSFFYGWIPNYGVAIIILTIVIKIALFPLTHKSYKSTSKMKDLQPKMKEIQEQYKETPSQLQQEMAKLYKREGVNPMSGCLPMLFQFPLLIAFFQMLNKNFELRDAVFIPGWITDLSMPEAVYTFSFSILMWDGAVRILPVLYLITQLIMGRLMQVGQANSTQTKMFTLYMPIIFFFVLYDMPSGLLLYWTVTNLLTAIQQSLISKVMHNRAEIKPSSRKKIAHTIQTKKRKR